MKKEVLFIHSAGPQGYHEGSEYPATYFRNALSANYKVLFPKMPDPEHPKYSAWKRQLKKELAAVTGEIILIGHSLGGSVLLKYLSEENSQRPVAGLFLIGTVYWGATDWEVDEYVLQEDFSAKLQGIPRIFLYHSKDDEVVPVTHLRYYAEELPKAIVREFDSRGHLFRKGLPELVEDIKSL